MKTIGIIGAGATGLCSIKHSLANGLSPIAWEHGSSVGGTWNYTESIGKDELGYPIYSSMYKNLKTNLPKEIMGFPDFPFPHEEESFIHHTSVLRYLKLYAQKFTLTPYIKFNHHVNLVEPIFNEENPPSWRVTVENLETGEVSIKICDYVVICNGHYSKPRDPDIVNIDQFGGSQLHSHSYRAPNAYSGKTVAVLGAGPSGIDIAIELCSVATKVYLCHNLPIPIPSKLPSNMFQRKGIIEAHDNGFVLKDKSFIEADALMYCTGYQYDFPFLSAECKIYVENNQVRPLYKHVLHADYPSMGFPGLVYQVLPFPIFDVQIRYLTSIFSGKASPPTTAEMNMQTDRAMMRFVYEGNNPRKFAHIYSSQISYMKHLSDAIKYQHWPPVYVKLLNIVVLRGIFGFSTFKQYRYRVRADGSIKETFRGNEVATNWKLPVKILCRMTLLSVTNFSDFFLLLFNVLWKRVKILFLDILSSMGAWDNYR